MNAEQIEHELYQLNGKPVVIVRPFFGTQSDSFTGKLVLISDSIPMIFTTVGHISILFRPDDVNTVEECDTGVYNAEALIRLKGPADYRHSLIGV